MVFRDFIVRDTKLRRFNSGRFYREEDSDATVADLADEYGSCYFDGEEYVLIQPAVLDNGFVPEDDYNAFYAYAIKLGDEYGHDDAYDDYDYSEYMYCTLYQVKWCIPAPISWDEFWSTISAGGDFSELEEEIDWKHPDDVSLKTF